MSWCNGDGHGSVGERFLAFHESKKALIKAYFFFSFFFPMLIASLKGQSIVKRQIPALGSWPDEA
jgi:hypothetical protein